MFLTKGKKLVKQATFAASMPGVLYTGGNKQQHKKETHFYFKQGTNLRKRANGKTNKYVEEFNNLKIVQRNFLNTRFMCFSGRLLMFFKFLSKFCPESSFQIMFDLGCCSAIVSAWSRGKS